MSKSDLQEQLKFTRLSSQNVLVVLETSNSKVIWWLASTEVHHPLHPNRKKNAEARRNALVQSAIHPIVRPAQ